MKDLSIYIKENNEQVLDYLVKLYNKYNKKWNSSSITIAEQDKLGYIVPELEKILKHFNIKI